MEKLCNDCMQNDSDEDIQNVPSFLTKYNKLIKQPSGSFRPIDFIDNFKKNLYEALLFPENAKGFKFPARKKILISFFSFPNSHLYLPTKNKFPGQMRLIHR